MPTAATTTEKTVDFTTTILGPDPPEVVAALLRHARPTQEPPISRLQSSSLAQVSGKRPSQQFPTLDCRSKVATA
jgi:hypothetical protein